MTQSRKTEENVKIFHTILDIFGDENEKCKVQTYWNETKEYWIDIVICADSPCENVISYGTIALSDFSIGKMVDDIPLGVEIVGACENRGDKFSNIISTCAGRIIQHHESCFPGAIYQDVIEMYLPTSTMKHVLFVSPFGWDKEFETLHFQTKKVAWLLAIPISEAERQYANVNGPEALEKLFEEKQINIYDLFRKSVL